MPEPPPEVVTLDMVPLDEIEDLMAAGPDSPAAELAMLDPPSTPEVAPAQQPAAKATESQGEKALQVALEHLEAGDIPRADTELRTALRLFEEDAEHRKALSVLDALLSLNGDDVVLHHQKAEYAITLNDRATLIRSYMDLGATLRRQAAPRSARSVYGRVLEIDPENADALQAIADLDDIELEQERERRPAVRPAAQTERADFDGLLDDLKTQVSEQASDTDYDSHLALGLSFKARGMLDEAIRELQIAVRGLADPLAAYEALGEAFISNGQPGIAYRALEKAVHLEGNDERKVGCLYWLGVAAQEQGELSRARAFFERVMTVDIDYRDTGTRITDCAS
jgi:tetratricopeptide (TPR) repeat protein